MERYLITITGKREGTTDEWTLEGTMDDCRMKEAELRAEGWDIRFRTTHLLVST